MLVIIDLRRFVVRRPQISCRELGVWQQGEAPLPCCRLKVDSAQHICGQITSDYSKDADSACKHCQIRLEAGAGSWRRYHAYLASQFMFNKVPVNSRQVTAMTSRSFCTLAAICKLILVRCRGCGGARGTRGSTSFRPSSKPTASDLITDLTTL